MISNIESFDNAMKIYSKLKKTGEFERRDDPALFSSYKDDDVRELLTRVQEMDKVRIFQDERSLFMIPEIDNELYRYTNEELRQEMKLKNNSELFTIQFMWMVILGKFYGDQYEQTGEPRSFIPIDEIREFMDESIESFKTQQQEKIEELSNEYLLSLDEIIKTWEQLGTISENTKSVERSTTKDYGFMYKGLRFWEENKLIIIREREIILTEKGRIIPEHYYHQEDNIKKIFTLMEKVKNNERQGGE
jgi:hypothetical protein